MTEHFHVRCSVSREWTERHALLLELMHTRLERVFPTTPVLPDRLVTATIYSGRGEFLQRAPHALGRGPAVAGYYRPLDTSITTYHGRVGFTRTTAEVLFHEVTHCRQGRVLGSFTRAPPWILEGLAIYLGEGSAPDAEGKKLSVGRIPRARLACVQEGIRAGARPSLQELTSPERSREDFPREHCTEAWALVYFLVNGGEAGAKLLEEYWATALRRRIRSNDLPRLARKHFGGLEALERQCTSYLLGLELPPGGRVDGDRFVSSELGFRFQRPAGNWSFREDPTDRKLLVELRSSDASARIRLCFDSSRPTRVPADGLRREAVDIGGLAGHRLEAPGSRGFPVVRYVVIETDGILTVDCLAERAAADRWAGIFDSVPDRFEWMPPGERPPLLNAPSAACTSATSSW